MKQIMRPWIGPDYRKDGLAGGRIMIVGESAYKPGGIAADLDVTEYNRALVLDAIGWNEGRGYVNKGRFNSRIARIFGCNPNSFAERKKFWESIAFYNFIQTVLSRPREVPLADMWQDAQVPFAAAINEACPTHVLCFSKRMWPHILKTDADTAIANQSNTYAREADLKVDDNHTALALSFCHPSSFGFKWQDVRSIIVERLKRAGRKN